MWGSSDLLQRMFADQFEQNGDFFLYRWRQKGAPIQVSAEEHERFIRQFKRRMMWLSWGLSGSMVLLVVAMLIVFIANGNQSPPDVLFWAPLLLMLPIYLAVNARIWDAPKRELANRLPVGPERSREEMKRLALRRLTWGRIGAIPMASLLLLSQVHRDRNLWSGANLAWICFVSAMLGVAVFAAVRKLRYERSLARGER